MAPCGDRDEAERGLEERRLAAAVRTAQAAELAARDLEGHVLEHRPAVEAHADAAREERGAHRSASSMACAMPRSVSS